MNQKVYFWVIVACCACLISSDLAGQDYPWLQGATPDSLVRRIQPPAGFRRIPVPDLSFAAWLRGLPLRPGKPPVLLHDGRHKTYQGAHVAVVQMDVGRKNLQQCADAVIRLRAEYLFARDCEERIVFHFTSGDAAAWTAWRDGRRPRVGRSVSWSEAAKPDPGYRNFKKYLEILFIYAGSASLERELEPVADPARLEVGDVFIQGGAPGHAVLVLDVAENNRGERVFLLGQSYMPAQDFHILKNPAEPESPWYRARSRGELNTPEWSFRFGDLRRFPSPDCSNP